MRHQDMLQRHLCESVAPAVIRCVCRGGLVGLATTKAIRPTMVTAAPAEGVARWDCKLECKFVEEWG